MIRNKIIILSIFILLAGAAAGFFGLRYFLPKYPSLACNQACQIKITPDHRFFADELLLVGETGTGAPFMLRLDMNRKKIADSFTHYYFADLIFQNQHKQLYTSFNKGDEAITPSNFLTAFSNTLASDLSAQENYAFTFTQGSTNIVADLSQFKGDFIVKNGINYTKYVSEGDAKVTVNGTPYTMHAMMSKIYTPYYDKYVFFDGYSDLKSLSQLFILWDKNGNFYLVDSSKVENELPDYKSHTWVLYKDRDGQYSKKAFSGMVDAAVSSGRPKSWDISIPEFHSTFKLSPSIFVDPGLTTGLAGGTVNTPTGIVSIQGYFSYANYGK
jgi:hypothetical protein